MRNRMYGGVRGRKMKVGGNYFIFLLLDLHFPQQYGVGQKPLAY